MKEKDTLISQTDSQRDPYRAMPEDFQIARNGDEAFHGQDNAKLRKARERDHSKSKVTGTGQPRATRPDDAGPTHTDGIDGAEGA